MTPISISTAWCNGCGTCVTFCPHDALRLQNEKAQHNVEKCIVCGVCEFYCPNLAITVDKSQKPQKVQKDEVRG